MLALRVICWIALTLRAARRRGCVLHPIALYFLLFSPAARRRISALPRPRARPPAGCARRLPPLLHAFSSTVLDRVYLLRGRFDLFDRRGCAATTPVEAEALAEAAALSCSVRTSAASRRCAPQAPQPGAPLLRARDGDVPGQRAPDQRRAACRSLPGRAPHVIALGRPHSMLALRDWLDAGGLAGLLADRTLPGRQASQRAAATSPCPFLGHAGAVQRRPVPARGAAAPAGVIFMAGALRRRQPLRGALRAAGRLQRAPAPMPPSGNGASAARARSLCRAARGAVPRSYPYNWFNFHDFWHEDAR